MSNHLGQIDPIYGEPIAELYRLYSRWLVGRLRRRFGDAAEDLAQEAYLGIARYRPSDIRHPKALLLRIALNAGSDHVRRARTAEAFTDPRAEPALLTASQDGDLILKETILSLPVNCRDVFVLHRFAGLSYLQIAEQTGLTVKVVEHRLSKAVAICAASLRSCET